MCVLFWLWIIALVLKYSYKSSTSRILWYFYRKQHLRKNWNLTWSWGWCLLSKIPWWKASFSTYQLWTKRFGSDSFRLYL